MVRVFLVLACLLTAHCAWAQKNSPSQKMYHVKYKWEVPVSAAFFIAVPSGFKKLDKVAALNEEQVAALNPGTINGFDRPVAFYDPSNFAQSAQRSDLILNISVASPIVLLLDKRVRKDWADFITIFMVAHMVDNSLYFASAFSVRRPRPLTYNPEVSMVDKTGVGKSNAFFSGHTSWSATSTFLIAKMYTDYHGIKGWKRMVIYTGAALPPGLVGYYRMHAGKHFKTDVITGLLVGAACGIGVPELHRNKNRPKNLSVLPFFRQGANGISLRYALR